MPALKSVKPHRTIAGECASWLLALILLIAFFPGASSTMAQERAGFVLESQGSWTLQGQSSSLFAGRSLPAGGVLANSSPRDGDHIIVADLQGEVLVTVRCRDNVCKQCSAGGGCYDPIQPLPGNSQRPNSFSKAFEELMYLFTSQPDRYSVHRVRGLPSDLLKETVLPVNTGTIDLSQYMQGHEGGLYEFEFASLGRDQQTGDSQARIVTMKWSPNEKAKAMVRGVPAGLYRIVYRGEGRSGSCWMLISEPAQYSSLADSYNQFLKRLNRWSASISEGARVSYERAYLEYLFRSTVEPGK